MPGYSFRIRFNRAADTTLAITASEWKWDIEGLPSLLLHSENNVTALKDSVIWVFMSHGWASEEEALRAAQKYFDALMLTFARLRIGADFGIRSPESGFTSYGLDLLAAQCGNRCLNDVHGLMVYESDPPPRFASFTANAVRGVPRDKFENIFSRVLVQSRSITDREKLSLNLFNASFFQDSIDARFLMLMMAIEALMTPTQRSPAAVSHIESLLLATNACQTLQQDERESIKGALSWLKLESINQAGRKLAETHLGDKTYLGKQAPAFFSFCYQVRSRLIHGNHPTPSRREIGSYIEPLEMFVSDLLSGEIREVR